jgi:hypothetical protein
MREGLSIGRMMGQALEANLRYVTLATRVANSVAGAAITGLSGGGGRAVTAHGEIVQQKPLAPPRQPPRAPSAILLEGVAGSKPIALFLLQNHLPHEVVASVEITPLLTPSGRKLKSTLQIDKQKIVLAPGQEVMARISAPITTKLVTGETYAGEIRIQGIPGATVPLVLRRIPDPQRVQRRQRLTAVASADPGKKAKPARPRRRATAKTVPRP